MADNQIKWKFVDIVLREHGSRMVKDIKEGIRHNQYQGTGRMESMIDYSVDRSNDSDGTLHIATLGYLRILDIRATHRKSLKKLAEIKRQRKIKENQFVQRKGFYAKSVYQHITPIVWDLSYGFTEDVIENIRKIFEGRVVTGSTTTS